MNAKQLKYVLALAHEGSFSKAADALDISQPSLSQYIKKLENQIGQELFDRTSAQLRLTDAGRVYVDLGRQILDLEHQMQMKLADIGENRGGSLVIGASPYRAAGMLPTIAKAFQQTHPGVHLIVWEGTTAELAEGMERGEYDLALTLLPVEERLFCYEKVTQEELILAVPRDYPILETQPLPERRYPAVDAAVLDGQRMVMLTDRQYMQKRLEDLRLDYGLHFQPAAIVKSLEAQIAMVSAGVGMALVPSGIAHLHGAQDVRFYSFVQPLPQREVVLRWRKEIALSKTAQALKTVIRNLTW